MRLPPHTPPFAAGRAVAALALLAVSIAAAPGARAGDGAAPSPRAGSSPAHTAAAAATTPPAAPQAHPQAHLPVQGFDAQRWAALLREPGPALVVFTATDCAHCPQAIDRLVRHQRDERRAGRPVPRLDVVVLDGRDQPEALASEPHYRQADRLFAVDGQAARLRHAVNPAWFGQTPYVALLGSRAAGATATLRFVSGTPSDRDLGELR